MDKTQLEARLRPIAPDDLERLRRFGCQLSPQTRYQRFLTGMRRLPEPLLHRFVEVDHHDREALVAVDAGGEIVGVARYDRIASPAGPSRPGGGADGPGRGADVADVAIVIADAWQRRGLGSLLLGELAEMALAGGIGAWTASCLSDNRAVHSLVRRGWPAARARRDGILAEYLLPLPMRREGEPVRPSVPPAAAPVWSAVPAQTVVSAQPAVPAQTVVVSAQPAVPERPAVPARPVGSPRQPAVPAQPVGSPSQPAVPVHPAVAALSAWSGGLAAAPGSSPLPGLAAMVAALSALSGRDDGNLERSPGVATARRM